MFFLSWSIVFSSFYLNKKNVIKNDLTYVDDILREVRSLSVWGNILIRKSSFCTYDVLCCLFKTFCISLYCSALWSNFRQTTLYMLKVRYNNIMRRLIDVARWQRDRNTFVTLHIGSFDEALRYASFSCQNLVCEVWSLYLV